MPPSFCNRAKPWDRSGCPISPATSAADKGRNRWRRERNPGAARIGLVLTARPGIGRRTLPPWRADVSRERWPGPRPQAGVCYLPAMLWGGLIWDDRIWSQSQAVLEWSGLGTIWSWPSLIEHEKHYAADVYNLLAGTDLGTGAGRLSHRQHAAALAQLLRCGVCCYAWHPLHVDRFSSETCQAFSTSLP